MADRIALLRELIDARYQGVRAEFARAIGRSPSQVSQWLSGHRTLGDAGCRLIEFKLDLPQGYFGDAPEPAAMQATRYYRNLTRKATPMLLEERRPKQLDPDPIIAEVIAIMRASDRAGRLMALGAVKAALASHQPAQANSRK